MDSEQPQWNTRKAENSKLFAIFAFSGGPSNYGFRSRNNWAGLDMGFVTVNWPPVTAGELVTSSHGTGGVRFGVDCSVNPVAVAGQYGHRLSFGRI